MIDWASDDQRCRAGAAPPQVPAPTAQVAHPPSPSAVEHVAEILEALFAKTPELTADLLSTLARCDVADIAKLFGATPSIPPAGGRELGSPDAPDHPAKARGEIPHVDAGEIERLLIEGAEKFDRQTAERPAEGAPAPAEKPSDPHANWRWDETGRRTWPPRQSAFEPIERGSERPPSRATHWSR
jgi:hypothetical protein